MSELEKVRCSIDEIDRQMAQLFEQRMDAVRQVAEYKNANNLPIEDSQREEAVVMKNVDRIVNANYRPYYTRFLRSVMKVSKDMQGDLAEICYVATTRDHYPVVIRGGSLHHAGEILNLNRKVLVVTDSGVPEEYVMTVASQCEEAVIFAFEHGEKSKTMDTYNAILQTLLDNRFTRSDCVVAVGGGVVGDVAGFAAATYMRGIDFYNIPTTVLSQVDSSVGGKTAVNVNGYKNMVGSFYAPKAVLIDTNTLKTLPKRQVTNGVAEMIKMAMTHDSELFALLESADDINEEMISRAVAIKKQVVEADEFEGGLRMVLNFGHTLGHAIESISDDYYHGECVAMGMIPMCASDVRERLIKLLKKWDLPTGYCGDVNAILDACCHDKKMDGDYITVVKVPQIGTFERKRILITEFKDTIREVMG